MDITMGNDEFILYIRKNGHGVGKSNDRLGRLIWEHLRADGAIKEQEDQPCHWGETGAFIGETDLPKTATQFRFDRNLLPQLYDYLDSL